MIDRYVTRCIYPDVEITRYTNDSTTGAVAFVLTTAQALYVGYRGKFAARYFDLGTASTESAATLTVEQWDGSAWTAVEDLIDETNAFQQNGFIHWVNSTWEKDEITGISDTELYYVKITTDTNLSAGTTLNAVLNLYTDDSLVRAYYPEIIADTGGASGVNRYLPPGRTDFLTVHRAAKNMVVTRLKQRRVIEEEAQIIDINAVALATVHAFAYTLLNPIARSEAQRERADQALKDFDREIAKVNFDVDEDEDGKVSDTERNEYMSARIVRR